MITVHHLNDSRSQRVLWLLEELGLPYEIKHYQRDSKTMLAPPELRAVHPLGKSPVIVEMDEGVRLLSRVLDCPASQLRIDLPVAVDFVAASDAVRLPVFRRRDG